MYRFIARHILAPGLDFLRGTQSMKLLKELEESQWWSRDKILDLQNQRLRMLINYAYEKVPYYRRVFDERGLKPADIESSNDLVKLPILTKHLVQSNFDEITAQGFPVKQRVLLATGGSTGQPLKFYTTKRHDKDLCIATLQRSLSWIGFELGDKSLSIANIYPYKSWLEKLMGVPISFFQRKLALDIGERPANVAKKLGDFRPRLIRGFTSALEQLALFIKKSGKPVFKPSLIFTGAEQLNDYQRELFREIFGCDTYDFYGAVEEHVIGIECKEHSGYHIAAENVIVEIVDAEGKPAVAGEEGRILVTSLYNYAMPFIRYEIGDIGVLSDKICPCGRGLPLLASINGRTLDTIYTKSKGPILGFLLYKPLRTLAELGVDQCQIVQDILERVLIKLIVADGYPQKYRDELQMKVLEIYKGILGKDMEIDVQFVGQIDTTPTGKRRFIISNVHSRNDK
jgi:phenylacetate-CoA ligase